MSHQGCNADTVQNICNGGGGEGTEYNKLVAGNFMLYIVQQMILYNVQNTVAQHKAIHSACILL